jgi:hypothetical protein
MDHFNKHYYALNKSNTKNILISVVRKGDGTFFPLLHIYSEKYGCRMSLRQYLDMYNSSQELFDYLNGMSKSAFLDISTDNNPLFISGKMSTCSMLVFNQQVDETHTSAIYMAKNTFEQLLNLRPIVQRLLLRFEHSMPDMIDTYKKHLAGEKIDDKINMHGFDITTFALELKLYPTGVTEGMF